MVNVELSEECVRTIFVVAETREEAKTKANAYFYTEHEQIGIEENRDLGEIDSLDCFDVSEVK